MVFKRLVSSFLIIIATCSMIQVSGKISESEEIIGGYFAKPRFLKHQVGIFSRPTVSNFYITMCGAGIIADNFVISAAHCFLNSSLRLKKSSYFVVFNIIDFKNIANAPKVDIDVIYTPHYEAHNSINDLTVIKLKKSFELNKNPHLSKLDLPKPYEIFRGQYGIVSGFGCSYLSSWTNPFTGFIARFREDANNLLKYGTVQIVSEKECQRNKFYLNNEKQLCGKMIADYPGQHCGICWGDSGNALVVDNKLVGIVSRGSNECNDSIFPGIYTQVSSFVFFIRQILKGHPTRNTYIHRI